MLNKQDQEYMDNVNKDKKGYGDEKNRMDNEGGNSGLAEPEMEDMEEEIEEDISEEKPDTDSHAGNERKE